MPKATSTIFCNDLINLHHYGISFDSEVNFWTKIAFEELSYAEKQIGGVFWVDGKSYIRRNGELYSVLGIAVPGSSDGQYTTAPVDNTEVVHDHRLGDCV